MTDTTLFDLVDACLAKKWIKNIERESDCPTLAQIAEAEKALKAACDENASRLLSDFKSLYVNMIHDKCYFFNVKLLNLGIQIGMELQRFTDDYKRT